MCTFQKSPRAAFACEDFLEPRHCLLCCDNCHVTYIYFFICLPYLQGCASLKRGGQALVFLLSTCCLLTHWRYLSNQCVDGHWLLLAGGVTIQFGELCVCSENQVVCDLITGTQRGEVIEITPLASLSWVYQGVKSREYAAEGGLGSGHLCLRWPSMWSKTKLYLRNYCGHETWVLEIILDMSLLLIQPETKCFLLIGSHNNEVFPATSLLEGL